MALDTESFNKQLYDLLKVRGYKPVPKNSRNQNVEASQLADVMEFVFMKEGEEYGKAWASIDDANNVIIYYDDEQADSPEGKTPGVEYDDSWSGFLKHVKNWAQRKQLSFELANKDRLSDDMRQREYVKMKEKISEGYHPMGNKASYNDNVPNIKIILQHNRRIEEGEQRYRNVAKIFLENTEGERILAPTTRPGIAQVYARHLAEGGVPNDERWNHIKGLCEEYSKMAGFVRATRNNQFNESAQALVNEGINHYQSLRESLSKMRGHRGYNAYFESWTPPLMEEENDDSINELFVQETVDPRIESVMPILSRLSKKSGIKPMTEVSELAEWAQSIVEGETKSIVINGKEVDYASLEIDGVDGNDYPDFSDAYFSSGYFTDGTQMSDEDLDQLADKYGELVNRKAYDSLHEGGDGGEASEEEDVYTDADAGEEMDASAEEEMLEAPGAETLGHNQSTEKSNLAAFDLGEALDPIADKIAELEKQLRTATPQEAQKIKEILTLLKAKANKGSSNPSDGGTAADRAEQRAKDRFSKKSSVTGDNIGDTLKGGAALMGFLGLGEGRMAETDSIIQDIINGDLDAYDVMANPKTPEEEYVANMMQEMYDDVSIEYSLHPDDDFEKILDIVVDQLAKDHKHDDNQLSMLEGDVEEGLLHQGAGWLAKKLASFAGYKALKPGTYIVPPLAQAGGKPILFSIRSGSDYPVFNLPPDEKYNPERIYSHIKAHIQSGNYETAPSAMQRDYSQKTMPKEDVEEDLDANQKRVGQLGPTEKVGPKGAVGKLVGASESIEVKEGQDDLDALKRLLNRY